MNWILVVAILIIIGYILDREIYFYEGAHLGPRAQSWLYDRWSKKYDEGKRESQLRDREMLALPLLGALKAAPVPEPFILDFATGTGRLSSALMSQVEFKGRVIAVDISQGMLEQASEKLAQYRERIDFLRLLSFPLPFPDHSFDAVCCLEVLELLPDANAALQEMTRVLRPGGILLTSRGTEESGRKAKVKSKSEFGLLLTKNDFTNFQIAPWWKLFDRVVAMKNGSSNPVGARKLSEVMRCSACGHIDWEKEAGALKCQKCGKELPITKGGIVLN